MEQGALGSGGWGGGKGGEMCVDQPGEHVRGKQRLWRGLILISSVVGHSWV